MRVLRRCQTEGASQRIDRAGGRSLAATLFEADKPIDADAGAFRHFLALQAGRTTASRRRNAECVRTKPLTTGAQEISEGILGAY